MGNLVSGLTNTAAQTGAGALTGGAKGAGAAALQSVPQLVQSITPKPPANGTSGPINPPRIGNGQTLVPPTTQAAPPSNPPSFGKPATTGGSALDPNTLAMINQILAKRGISNIG